MPSSARHPVRILMLVVAALLLAGAPAVHADSSTAAAPNQYGKPPPAPWGACPVNGREEAKDKLVRRLDRGPGVSTSGAVMPGGTSDLICGDENHGYYHIANRHGSEWTQKGS